jgi:hypothetical protein
MDFQVNDQTYFLNVGDGGWEVMVATPDGMRAIPVYEDAPDDDDEHAVVIQDERKGRIVN